MTNHLMTPDTTEESTNAPVETKRVPVNADVFDILENHSDVAKEYLAFSLTSSVQHAAITAAMQVVARRRKEASLKDIMGDEVVDEETGEVLSGGIDAYNDMLAKKDEAEATDSWFDQTGIERTVQSPEDAMTTWISVWVWLSKNGYAVRPMHEAIDFRIQSAINGKKEDSDKIALEAKVSGLTYDEVKAINEKRTKREIGSLVDILQQAAQVMREVHPRDPRNLELDGDWTVAFVENNVAKAFAGARKSALAIGRDFDDRLGTLTILKAEEELYYQS